MKKTKKVSINLTEEQFNILSALARLERRTISDLAALIVVDNSRAMFLSKQEQGKMEEVRFVYLSPFPSTDKN